MAAVFGRAWSCAAVVRGCAWSCVRGRACVVVPGRACVVVRGPSCVVVRGPSCVVVRGRAWSCAVVRGRAWSCVVVNHCRSARFAASTAVLPASRPALQWHERTHGLTDARTTYNTP